MSTLGQKPATTHVSFQKQTITGNGGTSYTLQQSVGSELDIAVFVNNTRQEPTTAYTASGTTLVTTGAVNSSDSFYVMFLAKAINTTGLPVSAVNTASINANAVTMDKLATSGTLPALNGSALTNSGGFKSIQVFTSVGSSTYTKPAGINTVKVTCTGGGGGGGSGVGNWNTGGGGHAGGTAIDVIDVSSVSTVAVTVGAGGSGGSGADGSTGGTSSFGSFCSATGGEGGVRGGVGTAPSAFGGTATGGLINIRGGSGQSSAGGNANDEGIEGHGGASFWGDGASQGPTNAPGGAYVDGFDALVFGAGGGGGDDYGGTSRAGGDGHKGIVVVEEFA